MVYGHLIPTSVASSSHVGRLPVKKRSTARSPPLQSFLPPQPSTFARPAETVLVDVEFREAHQARY